MAHLAACKNATDGIRTSHGCRPNAICYMEVIIGVQAGVLLLQTCGWKVHLCISINFKQLKTDWKNLIRKQFFKHWLTVAILAYRRMLLYRNACSGIWMIPNKELTFKQDTCISLCPAPPHWSLLLEWFIQICRSQQNQTSA